MSGFARRKRVTDPLRDKVKARIIGRDRRELFFNSSGSEHSAEADEDEVSSSLAHLVHGFLEDDVDNFVRSSGNVPESASDLPICDSNELIQGLMQPIRRSNADPYGNLLAAHVSKAMEVFSSAQFEKPILRRNVMSFLRNFGYNAAVCKTKWESSGGLASGSYEFIDVLRTDRAENRTIRYFIDIDFSEEFQIARPTDHYERVVRCLPSPFVGRNEELKQILRIMSNACRQSLKSRDLLVPPWRKNSYLQSKWLGSYRRTTNLFPANSSLRPAKDTQAFVARYRLVGFSTAGNGDSPFPAPTAT